MTAVAVVTWSLPVEESQNGSKPRRCTELTSHERWSLATRLITESVHGMTTNELALRLGVNYSTAYAMMRRLQRRVLCDVELEAGGRWRRHPK